uniref:Uncharacterized protein n=1 Tax=Cyanistes caeruleus TaxID=156563 RepID=A0A8C0UHG1_CYACU
VKIILNHLTALVLSRLMSPSYRKMLRISCPFHCREQAAQGTLLTPSHAFCSVPSLDVHPVLPTASPAPKLSSSIPGPQEYARGTFTRGKNDGQGLEPTPKASSHCWFRL